MKKVLATMLSLLLVISMMSIAVSAETTDVAKIGDKTYATLADAIAEAPDGTETTVTLINDVSGTVVIPKGKNIYLDLAGKKITASSTAILNNGTLTIADLSESKAGLVKSTGNVSVGVGDYSNTTITGGNFEAPEGAVITGYAVGAKIVIISGNFTATDNAVIAGNGNKTNSNKEVREVANEILITGGKFTGNIKTKGYIACGIYAPWKDKIVVSGGEFIVNGGVGIIARAGNVTVSGGVFKVTGTASGWVGDNKNLVPSSVFVFDAKAAYPALTESDKITVSAGVFSSEAPNVNVIAADVQEESGRVTMSGGSYSDDSVKKYVAENYEVVKYEEDYIIYRHNPVAVEKVDATCAKAGVSAHYKCEACGKLYSDEKGTTEVTKESLVIPATGKHTYKDGKCSVCSKVDPNAETIAPIDTTKPVEEVQVGVSEDNAKDNTTVVNTEADKILETVVKENTEEIKEELKEVVEEKVIDAIVTATKEGKNVEVTTQVVAKVVEENEVDENAVALVVEKAEEATVVQYLDLSVIMNVVVEDTVVESGEIKQLAKPITFTIAVPEELKTVDEGKVRTYYVIRVHGDQVDKLPVTVNDDGTLSFETDRFSTYALTYEDTDKTPETGDATNMMLWFALMAASACFVAVLIRKRRTA